jgi:hypothetical protein
VITFDKQKALLAFYTINSMVMLSGCAMYKHQEKENADKAKIGQDIAAYSLAANLLVFAGTSLYEHHQRRTGRDPDELNPF